MSFVLSWLFCTGLAAAQPIAPAPGAGTLTPVEGYRKGAINWRVLLGGAMPVEHNDSEAERRMRILAFEFGRVMTERHGPGPLAGQLELLVQAEPIVAQGVNRFLGIGLTPLFVRWNFAGVKWLRPIAEGAAGVMLVDWAEAGPGDVIANFYEQVGLGLCIGYPTKLGLTFGVRYQHISNGGRAKPTTGLDAYLLYAGVSFLQQRR
jgi:hypothetical protein